MLVRFVRSQNIHRAISPSSRRGAGSMQGTIDGLSYGLVAPVAAYLTACLGSALGLRCTVRSLALDRSRKPGWLALGAVSIGCGIWSMHFIAMLGFQVSGAAISYDTTL